MSDDVTKWLEAIKAPPWVHSWLVPALGLILLLGDLFEVPERLGFDPPAGDLIMTAVAGFLIWLWLIQVAHRSESAVKLLVFVVAALCTYAAPHIWAAYTGENPPLLAICPIIAVPLVIAYAVYRAPEPDRDRIAIGFGAALAGLVLFVGIWRAEDWYLLHNTLLTGRFAAHRTGIAIARYNKDKDVAEHQRLSEELQDLLRHDETLRPHVQLKLLPRKVPGYVEIGTVPLDEASEQEEAARHIGRYLGASIVAYGADLKKLSRTRIVLVQSCDKTDPLLPRTEINIDGPKADARMVHLLAATIAGLVEVALGNAKGAEKFFDEALKAAPELEHRAFAEGGIDARLTTKLRLLKAISISHQVMTGSAAPERGDEALAILKSIADDPNSGTLFRRAAALDSGVLLRNLSISRADSELRKGDLVKAAEVYTKLLQELSQERDEQRTIASVLNNLGVVEEKLAQYESPIDHLQKAEVSYLQAEAAYTAMKGQQQTHGEEASGSGCQPYSRLLPSVQNNLGVTLAKQGMALNNAALLKQAIASYQKARANLKDSPNPELEPLLVSNLADAYHELAEHEDRSENLDRARGLLLDAVKLRGVVDYPAVRGEIMFKLGQVDVALGRAQDNPVTRRAVQEWACSYDIFLRAGRTGQAAIVVDNLKGVDQQIVGRALNERAPFSDCQWDAPQLIRILRI